jgi:hypothetical protein
VSEHLPSWPTASPTHGSVVLREFSPADVHYAVELGDDPYVPLIGSLPAQPSPQQALEWVERQRGRLSEGIGLSFAIADNETNTAVGPIGLWLQNLSAGRAIGLSLYCIGSSGTSNRATRVRFELPLPRDTNGKGCSAAIKRSAASDATCCSALQYGREQCDLRQLVGQVKEPVGAYAEAVVTILLVQLGNTVDERVDLIRRVRELTA